MGSGVCQAGSPASSSALTAVPQSGYYYPHQSKETEAWGGWGTESPFLAQENIFLPVYVDMRKLWWGNNQLLIFKNNLGGFNF